VSTLRLQAPPGDGPRALSLVPNSLALIAAKVATLGLGFLFWLVAARLMPAAEVGLAAGIVAAVLLCSQLGLMGAGAAVVSLFPAVRTAPGELLDSAVNLVVLVGGLAGLLFVAIAAGAFPELGVVGSSLLYTALFVAMCVLGAVGVLLDQVSTAQRRGDHALVRGVLNGTLSLAALGALALLRPDGGSEAIFTCWVVGGAAACALGVLQLRRSEARYRWRARLQRDLARRIVAVGVPNHALTLADRAPALVLPVLVTELLSPEANAYWYAVWMMAWVVLVVPVQVGMTLFAEASRRPAAVDGLTREALSLALRLGVVGAAGLCVLAPLGLQLMGPGYADAGTTPLRVLCWSVLPVAVVQCYYARCRAAGRLRQAIATAAVSGVATIAAATAAGVSAGLTAMAATFVGVQALTAAWALWRTCRSAAAPVADARRVRRPDRQAA
jgi:O-antigen/teichoic acid export membrane protein